MEAAIAVRNKDGVIKAEAKALKTGEVIFAWASMSQEIRLCVPFRPSMHFM